jgi:hypothetical protein
MQAAGLPTEKQGGLTMAILDKGADCEDWLR